jgi:hypothetical protein
MMTDDDPWVVKPGDRVRRVEWGYAEPPEIGEVLAVAPVPCREWPDVPAPNHAIKRAAEDF